MVFKNSSLACKHSSIRNSHVKCYREVKSSYYPPNLIKWLDISLHSSDVASTHWSRLKLSRHIPQHGCFSLSTSVPEARGINPNPFPFFFFLNPFRFRSFYSILGLGFYWIWVPFGYPENARKCRKVSTLN